MTVQEWEIELSGEFAGIKTVFRFLGADSPERGDEQSDADQAHHAQARADSVYELLT